MKLLSIPAGDIDVAGLALDVTLPVAWLDSELSDAEIHGAEPARLTARLSRSGHDIVVRGRVKGAVTIACARCLGPARIPVDTELSLLLRPAPADARPAHAGHAAPRKAQAGAADGGAKRPAKGKEPEYEFAADEAELDTYDGDTVVLDPFVREAILLEMPNFPLCSEACPGIGPGPIPTPPADAAAAEGVDPRLAPLRALRDRLGSPKKTDKE